LLSIPTTSPTLLTEHKNDRYAFTFKTVTILCYFLKEIHFVMISILGEK
jgi:hypothetical protein